MPRIDFKKYIQSNPGNSKQIGIFKDGRIFFNLIRAMAKMSRGKQFSRIACIEGKGFVFGSAVAFYLKKGFVLIRREGKFKKNKYSVSYKDYSGKKKTLEIQKDVILKGERILIVDDWVDTGETLKAAIKLIERCGGVVAGTVVFMDDLKPRLRPYLGKYGYVALEKVMPEDKF